VIMILMEQVYTRGVMDADMKAHGRRIRCMDRENSLGLMVGHTKEAIL